MKKKFLFQDHYNQLGHNYNQDQVFINKNYFI